MRYISIDIETTGLDKDEHDILEVCAIHDDLSRDWRVPMNVFRAVVIQDCYGVTPFCAELHKRLWPEIVKFGPVLLGDWDGDEQEVDGVVVRLEGEGLMVGYNSVHSGGLLPDTYYCTPDKLRDAFNQWVRWVLGYPDGSKINIAGKNVAGFDWPFLCSPAYSVDELVRARHRVLDPAILYWHPSDLALPDLTECLLRAGMSPSGLHSAHGDALDVIRLIRHKLLGSSQA